LFLSLYPDQADFFLSIYLSIYQERGLFMEPIAPRSLNIQKQMNDNLHAIKQQQKGRLFQQPGVWLSSASGGVENVAVDNREVSTHGQEQLSTTQADLTHVETQKIPSPTQNGYRHTTSPSLQWIDSAQAIEHIETSKIPSQLLTPFVNNTPAASQAIPHQLPTTQPFPGQRHAYGMDAIETARMPAVLPPRYSPPPGYAPTRTTNILSLETSMGKGKAAILIILLFTIVWQTLTIGPAQFLGSQGWSYVLAGPSNSTNADLLAHLKQAAKASGKTQTKLTPQQYVDLVISQMSLDQKIGQMMMIQFIGADYSLQLSTMISQYNVGSVLLFYANGNIVNKEQLKSLTQQMQQNSAAIPLALSIDQEGGTVDRLVNLDGPRPAAATIGATNDPEKATQAGLQDAQDLASYNITLNLAPVVDVDNLSTSEMHRDLRTFGTTPTAVSTMAGAYLKGLQQSGKVVGTLKHFPGLGYVNVDPHFGIPRLDRSKDDLEQIDWAPYRTLIQQGLVRTIMVTHEIVPAIDPTMPSSLSPKLVQNILRDEMHFQGVIMTDSLTMAGITNFYTPGQAAELAVKAGSDIIMGANSPEALATMIDGIKQGISDGSIPQAQIDQSVRRILMMKYQLGLLPLPKS
jgi:beta-N-acetylhexosaminidase